MRQSTLRKVNEATPAMRVVRALSEDNQFSHYVNVGWNFAYCSLWNAVQFSEKEVDTAKKKIADYLNLYSNAERGLIAFCERIVLARYYITNKVKPQPVLPTTWLDRHTRDGFAATKKWYDEIKAVRSSLPRHKIELRAIAEAVAEFAGEPTVQNYNYWRSYFIERSAPGLLSLFQVTAIHFFVQ